MNSKMTFKNKVHADFLASVLVGIIMSAILWVSFVKDNYKWELKTNPAVVAWVKGWE